MEKAVALIAVHLGVADEEKILDMSEVFFDNVIRELGYKLTYDAIANFAGNSFMKDAWEMIQDHNPITIGEGKDISASTTKKLSEFFNNADIQFVHHVDRNESGTSTTANDTNYINELNAFMTEIKG